MHRPSHRLEEFSGSVSIRYLKKDIRHRPESYQVVNKRLFTKSGKAVVCDSDGRVFLCKHGDTRIRDYGKYIAKVLDDYSIVHRRTYHQIIRDHSSGRRHHRHRVPSEDTTSSLHRATSHKNISDTGSAAADPSVLPDPKALADRSKEWIRFMSGIRPSQDGCRHSLQQIVLMKDEALEDNHQYIQWLFPNKHISPFNSKAPLLTEEIIHAYKVDKNIRYNVKLAVDTILNHVGIIRSKRKFKLDTRHPERYERWLPLPDRPDRDHNLRRITRMLEFLHTCGSPLAKSLHDFLQRKRLKNHLLPNNFWSDAIGTASAAAPSRRRRRPEKNPRRTAEADNRTHPKKHKPRIVEPLRIAPYVSTPPAFASDTVNLQPRQHRAANGPLAPYHIPVWNGQKMISVRVTSNNYDAATQLLRNNRSYGSYDTVVGHFGCVRFYDYTLNKDTYYLTNTYIDGADYFPVRMHGIDFLSAEHAFQYQKLIYSLNDNVSETEVAQAKRDILNARSGGEAADIAKRGTFKKLINADKWKNYSEQVMFNTIYTKFSTNPGLKEKLIATYPCVLIEHTRNDKFYGNNGDDSGTNLTGQILGQVRERLMKEAGFLPP